MRTGMMWHTFSATISEEDQAVRRGGGFCRDTKSAEIVAPRRTRGLYIEHEYLTQAELLRLLSHTRKA